MGLYFRTLLLLAVEAAIVLASFLLGTVWRFGRDSSFVLGSSGDLYKILGFTVVFLIASNWLDLYDVSQINLAGDLYFRLLLIPGVLAL